ncbi:allantoinase AllB [soil metagenome]
MTLAVRSRRVLLPDGIRAASVVVRDGRIEAIVGPDAGAAGGRTLDAGDLLVMPGIVDTHVHVNEPGRTAWEGFAHATRAAAAGGVTTIVDMPLNSVPATTTLAGMAAKLEAAAGQCHVDVGFWGGVVPGNAGEIEPLARRGVRGFKCFLSPSGVDEFEHIGEEDLRAALPILARIGLPLLVHAELPSRLLAPDAARDPRAYATWLASRPPGAEHAAIDLLIQLAREYGARIHIVHLASAEALPPLRAARAEGVPISVETCPHYLSFAAEEVSDGATAFKCAPPVRERRHREGLWRALIDKEIDLVATDHSPAPPALKHLDDGDFMAAWGGIASLQLGLAAVWTGAAVRGIAIEQVSRWMSRAPAAVAGLSSRKGAIAPGLDADLVFFDPDAEWRVDPAALQHRHPVTPYAGMTLRGQVRLTLLRGEVVFDRGVFPSHALGQTLTGGRQ